MKAIVVDKIQTSKDSLCLKEHDKLEEEIKHVNV